MLHRYLLYFFILDRKMSFASKPQVSGDGFCDDSIFPYWNEKTRQYDRDKIVVTDQKGIMK